MINISSIHRTHRNDDTVEVPAVSLLLALVADENPRQIANGDRFKLVVVRLRVCVVT